MIHAMLAAALAVTFPQQQQLDSTFAVRSATRLEIDTQIGSVTVRGWDRNEMRVQARYNRGMEIDIDRSGATISIDIEPRRGRATRVDIEVSVPRRFAIEIDAVDSPIEVADVEGDVHAETVNGDVTISRVRGRIAAGTVKGAVRVSDSRGDLEAESVNQDIIVTGHTGDIDAESVNGGIRLTRINAASVTAETVNGAVTYVGEIRAGGRYSLSSHAGDIAVTMPRGTNANVSVETFHGEIDADFPIQMRRGYGGRDRVSFTIGSGGARIHLETFGGSIRLRQSGEASR